MIFLSDQDLADELGVSLEEWESKAAVLERDGLPKRDALFGYRRCWPAVLEFFVKRAGGTGINTALPVGEGGHYRGFKKKDRQPKRANPQNEPSRDGAVVLDLHKASRKARLQADHGASPRD